MSGYRHILNGNAANYCRKAIELLNEHKYGGLEFDRLENVKQGEFVNQEAFILRWKSQSNDGSRSWNDQVDFGIIQFSKDSLPIDDTILKGLKNKHFYNITSEIIIPLRIEYIINDHIQNDLPF